MTYIYGGYIMTSGKFENGQEWTSLKVMVGKSYKKGQCPNTAVILKADRKLLEFINDLSRGCELNLTFDEYGKIIGMTYIN